MATVGREDDLEVSFLLIKEIDLDCLALPKVEDGTLRTDTVGGELRAINRQGQLNSVTPFFLLVPWSKQGC